MKSIHLQKIKVICAPEYPHSSHEIIRRLCAAIKVAEDPLGGGVDQQKVAQLIGTPKTTFNDWLNHDPVKQPILRFLSGLERLSDKDRIDFLRSCCRHCPRLDDPRISHDKHAVTAVEALVQRGPGMTLITGESDSLRTYLLTAIGNSFAARYSITGFDVHRPVDFVPVPGVFYPATNIPAETLPALFSEMWPAMAGIKDSLILLNGVWERISIHHQSMFKLAEKCHILIAGNFTSAAAAVRGARCINIIGVESLRGKSGPPALRIHVEISTRAK